MTGRLVSVSANATNPKKLSRSLSNTVVMVTSSRHNGPRCVSIQTVLTRYGQLRLQNITTARYQMASSGPVADLT